MSGGGGIGGGICELGLGEDICWADEKCCGGVGGGNVGGCDSLGLNWLFGDFFIWSVVEDVSDSSLVKFKEESFDWASWSNAK